MRILFSTALLLGAANIAHAGTTYYVDLVNTANNSITAFAIAPAGSRNFHAVPLGDIALHGGGDSATIAIQKDDSGCLRDLRTEFSNGRVLIQQNFDICKYRSYHTGQYLRGQAQTVIASAP
jgi:hypothetical protein